jgi:hypothetical protein
MGKRFFRRAALLGSVWLVAASGGLLAQAEMSGIPLPKASAANVPARFTGHWDYNDDESINAGTGRPEQTPASATTRSAANNTPTAQRGSSGRDGGSSGFENTAGVYLAQPTVTPAMIREAENFLRDILEVPEELRIRVSDSAVTFTDDLERERTYQTDGKGREYSLSASKFDVKMSWDGSQLKREVEGGKGFKVFETYFLSEDGERLFVIIRVKAPKRAGFVAGANRVYDRVNPVPDSSAR